MTFPVTRDSLLSLKVGSRLLQGIHKPSRNIRIRFRMKDRIRVIICLKIIFGLIPDRDWIPQHWSELVARSMVILYPTRRFSAVIVMNDT